MNRKDFLNIFFKNEKNYNNHYIRPPYFNFKNSQNLNSSLCSECETNSCINICEEQIIKKSIVQKSGLSEIELNFSEAGCTFCKKCAESCESGVLSLENSEKIVAKISLDPISCIAWHGVICSSCADHCKTRAIKFIGMFRPEIKSDLCTNCGWCLAVCPTEAIKIYN
jgi:ferredoxin-type protein NapF